MERYERDGFTRVFTNDLYEVERQLQDYDEHLYVMWNPHTGEHLVVDGLVGLSVMKIPQRGFPALTTAVVDRIRRIHTANGFSATAHVEAAQDRLERENEKRVHEMAENFARDTLKSARQIAYYQ
ncbi:2,3-dihydroxybenzoate--AMP ligase [Cohnella sp. GbtcB17]|uniref:2,3-dihydroxybenzoate--AMP ligase n=1 Tax=Cohnella sp. GbtcB17 TaxID=2824762 RepID=UPI001C31194D|nr:2,3-dihydroxybenzoate--AMP ligase [Cohnella sp. GbtcB17]